MWIECVQRCPCTSRDSGCDSGCVASFFLFLCVMGTGVCGSGDGRKEGGPVEREEKRRVLVRAGEQAGLAGACAGGAGAGVGIAGGAATARWQGDILTSLQVDQC
jgi:hypothetical protein